MRRIARHIYHVGMILIFVLVAMAGFTQTKTFRANLLGVLLDEVNASVRGSVWVSSLEGNLITGLRLHDVEVAAGGEELARIDEVRVSYDVVGFLLGTVRFSDIELVRPSMFIRRTPAGVWNLDEFLPIPASEAPDSGASPTMTFRRIQVEGGRLRIIDSVALAARRMSGVALPRRAVDYADIDISLLDIDAGLTLSTTGTRIDLQSLSFELPRHDVSVKKLAAQVELLENSIRIGGLEILTARSSLQLDGSLAMGSENIRTLADLEGVSTSLTFKAKDLDLGELRQFLYPHIEFLDRSVNLELKVSGTFDRLAVDRLALRTPASFIQMRGIVSNLHRPTDLTLNIQGDESVARSDDIHALLQGLTLPSWDRFGDVAFFFSFDGTPADFRARVSAKSERGNIDTDGHLTFGRFLGYKGTVRMENLDLGGFMGNGSEVSRLNALIEVDGSGTDLPSLIAVARIAVDTSHIYGVHVQRSVAIVDAAQGAFSGHLDAMTSVGAVVLTGRTNIADDGSVRTYTAQGTARGLDVADIAGIPAYVSDLNIDFAAGGHGDESGGRDSARIAFLDSQFGGHSISASTVRIRQDRAHGGRTITIESVPATVQIDGVYAIGDLPLIGEYAVGIIFDHARQTFTGLAPHRAFNQISALAGPVLTRLSPNFDTVDVRVAYELRSIEPIGALAGISLSGDASGSLELVGSAGDFQVSGRVTSSYFSVDDTSLQLAGRQTSLDFFADRLDQEPGLGHAGTSITLDVDVLRFDKTLVSSLALRTDVRDSLGMLSVDGLIDSTMHVAGIGSIKRTDGFAEFVFDHLRIESNAYSVQARDSVVAILGADGVLLRRAVFGSEEETITLAGLFHPGGVSDLRVDLGGFRASHFAEIGSRSPSVSTVAGLAGSIDATLLFRGSFNHPNITLDLTGRDVRLERASFGRLSARISYFERLLSMDISLNVSGREEMGVPDLLLRGSVPYDFVLAGERSEAPLEGEIDLLMVSTGIDLVFFEPFISSVTRELEGRLTCNIRMTGSLDEPRYEGMAAIRGGAFLFVPTRMAYRLDGNFLTADDRITLQNVVIRNTPADYANGLMNVSGSLFLSGITLHGFDLGFNGELRLMREDSSRLLGNQYYGDLTAATAAQGLTWKGTIDRSKLSGQLLIRNAQITLPPDRESQQFSSRLIDIVRYPDSLGVRARFALTARERSFAVTEVEQEQQNQSFVDRIDFDLTLETQGPTQVRFIFNTQANDVLFADLRGRLSFLRDQVSTRLIGDIEVTDRSYYNFLKRFSASGRMLFTGDPLNPELDIVARYQGIHKKTVSGSATAADAAQQTVDERVTVVLSLQGPRSALRTNFDIEVEDPNSTEGVRSLGSEGGNTDVEGDAIAFIMTGQFRDELTEQQQNTFIGENLGYGLASGLLTGPLSETLRRTTRGTIQSLDVIYYGGGQSSQGADVRVTGQLGEAVYRVGGRVFDNIDNTNVIVEIPLSALLNANELRNLILTLERRVEGTETLEDQRRSSNEARLQYRFRF